MHYITQVMMYLSTFSIFSFVFVMQIPPMAFTSNLATHYLSSGQLSKDSVNIFTTPLILYLKLHILKYLQLQKM